jgi:peptidoglycan/LPS O-acetylase OafA/YrhL
MSSNTRTDPDDGPTNDMDTDRRDERADQGANPRERGKWISALIAVLGLWMIVQALGLELAASQFWNDILVGVLLIGVGGYNYSRRADERLANAAVALIAVAAGLWLIAAPFVLGADAGFTETTNEIGFYNDIVVGLLAAGLGAYSAYTAGDHQQDTRRTTT